MHAPAQTAPKIFGGPVKTHLLVFTDAAESAPEFEGIKEPAKEIKGKLLTVTVASTNERVLSYFGIEKSEYRGVTSTVRAGARAAGGWGTCRGNAAPVVDRSHAPVGLRRCQSRTRPPSLCTCPRAPR